MLAPRDPGSCCPRGESAPGARRDRPGPLHGGGRRSVACSPSTRWARSTTSRFFLGDDDLTALAIKLSSSIRAWRDDPRSGRSHVDADVVVFVRDALRGRSRLRVPRARPPRPRPAGLEEESTPFSSILRTRAGEPSSSSPARRGHGRTRGDVFLAFGPRRAEESLRVQRSIAELGFTVRSLVRNFNDYLGAERWAETSHLYHLVTTTELRTLVDGRYEGGRTPATSASRFAPTGARCGSMPRRPRQDLATVGAPARAVRAGEASGSSRWRARPLD